MLAPHYLLYPKPSPPAAGHPFFPLPAFLSLATSSLLEKVCSGKQEAVFKGNSLTLVKGKCLGFSLGISGFL